MTGLYRFYLVPTSVILFVLPFVITTILPVAASADLVKIAGTSSYYFLIQDAYDAAIDADTILSQDVIFDEDLFIDLPVTVTLEGGYNAGFSAVVGVTVINGNMTVSEGTITIGNIVIGDNVSPLTVQWTASSQSSANESGTMTVTAQLSAVSGENVTVPYSVTGTATGGGTDYTITASPITITAGNTTGTATITIAEDTLAEGSETVILTMGIPTNATLGTTTVHTATITDDDSNSPPVLISTFGRGSYNTPGELNYPSGVTVDSAGNVYVCTDSDPSISKFDSNGNFITRWFLSDCLGLAADAQDNIYVAMKTVSKIGKYDSDGNLLYQWGAWGPGQGQFKRPNDVAVNNTLGLVYVADSENFRIQVFDTNGNYQFEWGSAGSGDGEFMPTRGPLGIAVDQNTGAIYVADSDAQRIQKFDQNGIFLLSFGGSGYSRAEGNFRWARNVEVNSTNGYVFVPDTDNERVQIFDSSGNFIMAINGLDGVGSPSVDPNFVPPSCTSHLSHVDCTAIHNEIEGPFHPRDVAVDSQNGYIYVAATYAQRMDKFDMSGNYIKTWGWYEKGNGVLNGPSGLAIDQQRGYIYVADTYNHLTQKFSTTGDFLKSWGASYSVCKYRADGGDGCINFQSSVATDNEGNIYVINPSAWYPSEGDPPIKRIQKFDQDGNWLLSWNYNDIYNPDQLHTHDLNGIVYNPVNDLIYVSNRRAIYGQYKLIQSFDKYGNFVAEFGSQGSGDGELNSPAKIAVDRNSGDIYVVDLGNSRIQRFSKDGDYLDKWGSYGIADNQFRLDRSSGIYLDDNGYVYIADSNNYRVKVFDSFGNFILKIIPGGKPSGVVVDAEGYIYILDTWNEHVDKYSPISP